MKRKALEVGNLPDVQVVKDNAFKAYLVLDQIKYSNTTNPASQQSSFSSVVSLTCSYIIFLSLFLYLRTGNSSTGVGQEVTARM